MSDQRPSPPTATIKPTCAAKPRSRSGRKGRTEWPDDPVSALQLNLAGVVASGLNMAALCSIFGVVEDWLSERLVKADLPALGNRGMRPSTSSNGWTIEQIRLLLVLWPTNLFATAIAERIGRSPASVRYKARWLGLTARKRSVLTRTGPDALPPLLPINHDRFTEDEDIDLGNAHLRGVSSAGTAVRQNRLVRDVELRASVLQLPRRTHRRGMLVMEYDPRAPLLKEYRNQGWHYRKCNFNGQPFWTKKDGPRTCRAAKKTKAYIDAYGAVLE